MHGWEAATLDQVGHVATQVGVDDLGAGDAHDLTQLFLGQIANLKNACLLGFDQKHGFIFDLGGDRGGHADFIYTVGHRCGLHAELNVHRRLLLLQEDGRGIGLLQRRFFQVHALNLEYGILVSHGNSLSK